MNYKIILLMISFLTCWNAQVIASESPWRIGVRAGGGISLNPNMGNILVPEGYYTNYTFKEKWMPIPTGGIFALYHKKESVIGIEGGIGYWQKSSELIYDDITELHYTVTPRYNILGISAMLKVYPFAKNFSMCIGGRVGANLTERALTYNSNQDEERFASVSETQRLLREKLIGEPDVSVGGGIGFEFWGRLGIDLRYFYGVTPTIRTEPNTFDWVEYHTNSHNIEFTLSWLFNL